MKKFQQTLQHLVTIVPRMLSRQLSEAIGADHVKCTLIGFKVTEIDVDEFCTVSQYDYYVPFHKAFKAIINHKFQTK